MSVVRRKSQPDPDDPLLDLDTWDAPRRLTAAERRDVTGDDWAWTLSDLEQDDIDD